MRHAFADAHGILVEKRFFGLFFQVVGVGNPEAGQQAGGMVDFVAPKGGGVQQGAQVGRERDGHRSNTPVDGLHHQVGERTQAFFALQIAAVAPSGRVFPPPVLLNI